MTSYKPNDRSERSLGQRIGAKNGRSRTSPRRPLMTAAALERVRNELAQLRRRANEESAERLREARSYGDGSNNDEYHAIREEQMVLAARTAAIEDTVARAVVIDPPAGSDGVAGIGSTVSIEDLASGARSEYQLASVQSADRHVISPASPMGRALMGASAGTVVNVDLPNGLSRSLRLIAVQSGGSANAASEQVHQHTSEAIDR